MPFNQGQLKAIMLRDASILVSAPAGSGKTKILVSRIIELLKEGYEIDEFLVLTFTEAAGNEMKQRLQTELNELVSTNIDSHLKQHLEKQILHLPNAYITNFHGFCNLLLMKYGYLVNVMPGFTINSDPTSIKKEVFKEYFENWILNKDYRDFFALYFPEYNYDKIEDTILSIDELSHSIDDFYSYVEAVYNNYYQIDDINDWTLFPILKDIFYHEILLTYDKLIELKYFCETNNLTDFYERPDEQTKRNQQFPTPFDSLYDYIDERIKAFSHSITYDTFISMLRKKPDKAYNMSWKEVDPLLKVQYNKLKQEVFKSYNNAIKSYIENNERELIDKINLSYQSVNLLLGRNQLLNQFQDQFSLRKRELNQLDFSDLEKYTHQLLEPQYGIVQKLHGQLKEIMVDEYQDTNQIQESLLLKISRYSDPKIPLFMVGDMKQSIYRFRQADPQIFLDKYNHFSKTDEECKISKNRRIDLIFNYRSSKIVLDSINYIFNAIMDKNIGGLEYLLDESARLNYDYDGKENGNYLEARDRMFHEEHLKTEVLIDIYDPNSQLDKEQYEAHMVCQKIIKLKEELKINDKPISFRDIAILMRSTPSFLTFKKVFDLYGIANHIVLSQGLMSSNEVISLIAFLKAINDPYDNISLLSVLRAPYTFSHIDEETIARIRLTNKEESLYQNLIAYQDKKIIHFIEVFNELKAYSYNHSPYELLLKIDEVTDYRLFVSQLINGEQRKANIDLFYEIIKQNQKDYPYLKDIIHYLDNAVDNAPGLANSKEDAVEFMTIHKSKGLEFPIVFICNMHKKFNMQDTKERLMIDKRLGFALKPRKRVKTENLDDVIIEYDNSYRNIIAKYQGDETVNEEMRILYVALTRASNKLILTGVINDINDIVDIQQKLLINSDPDIIHKKEAKDILLYDRLRKANNYLTWILAAILRHPDIIKQCLEIPELKENALKLKALDFARRSTFDSTEHAMFSLDITYDEVIEQNIPHRKYLNYEVDNQLQDYYDDYNYPYDITKKHAIAVTELQKLADDHYLKLDEENKSTVISATDKGTLVHLLLSYLSFKHDDIDNLINQLYREKLIDEEGRDVLIDYKKNIQYFIDSQYYRMISQSSYVYKEKSFSYFENNQIIHGIFDLVFIYNNQIYVLDYKTDRISSYNTYQKLIDKHKVQLSYYQKVLKDMYKQDVKAIVYYLHIGKGVEW